MDDSEKAVSEDRGEEEYRHFIVAAPLRFKGRGETGQKNCNDYVLRLILFLSSAS